MASVEARPLRRDRSTVAAIPDGAHTTDVHPGGASPVESAPSGGGGETRPWLIGDLPRESALTPYLPERWRGARLDPGSRGMLALCGVGAVVVILAAWAVFRDAPVVAPVPALPVVAPLSADSIGVDETSGAEATTDSRPSTVPDEPAFIVVSVVGLVSRSGIVHLPLESRVADALAAAGGPVSGADVLALNLAAKLHDGDQIVVGSIPAEGRPTVSTTMKDDGQGVPANSAPGPAENRGGVVDLNSATVAELDTLAGVGPVTAASIVAWREANGPFTDVAQLAEVDGIGPVRLEKLRNQVTV